MADVVEITVINKVNGCFNCPFNEIVNVPPLGDDWYERVCSGTHDKKSVHMFKSDDDLHDFPEWCPILPKFEDTDDKDIIAHTHTFTHAWKSKP